ncbi:hypothetical protein ACFE04_002006 [Oxalis oulophora]
MSTASNRYNDGSPNWSKTDVDSDSPRKYNPCFSRVMNRYFAAGTVPMHLSLVWSKHYPSLLNEVVVMSSIYGESWKVCVKANENENGEGMMRFIKRFQLTHEFKVDFQRISGYEFMFRIRDVNGVEIDYSLVWLDITTKYVRIKNKKLPTLCTIFWDEHVVKGELFETGSRIQREDSSKGEVRYTTKSSIEHSNLPVAIDVKDGGNANAILHVVVSERIVNEVAMGSGLQFKERSTKEVYDRFVADGSFGEGHIPTNIVREYLRPIGSPNEATMCLGNEKRTECIIKWGQKRYGDQAHITRPMKEIISEMRVVPDSKVLFNIIAWDSLKKSVTFEFVNLGT